MRKVANMNQFSEITQRVIRAGRIDQNHPRGFIRIIFCEGCSASFTLSTKWLKAQAEVCSIPNYPNLGPRQYINITDARFGYSTQLSPVVSAPGANGGLNPLYLFDNPPSIRLARKVQF
jgi:hypothetical protein